jgi:hypothetical protein
VAEVKADVRDWLPKRSAGGGPAPRFDPSPVPIDWNDLIRAPAKASDDQLFENSRAGARTVVRKSLNPYRVGGLTSAALERMLGKCRAHGIRIMLLGIPTCSPHRDEYTPAIESIYDAYLQKLIIEYDCRYVDSRDWVPDKEFLDTLHVDDTGGKHFTRRLADEVLKPLVP